MAKIYQDMDSRLVNDVTKKLEERFSFKASQDGRYLRGECPDCEKKEAFTWAKRPGVVICQRDNGCGTRNSIRELFPELFEEWSERYPPTEKDPKATARAYLTIDRQLSLSILQGKWEQGYVRLRDGTYAETVKFPLWDDHYWQRILDKSKIPLQACPPEQRKKAKFSNNIKYGGKHWIPPEVEIKKGDTVRIVEGIFHCIALWMHGIKAVAAFSSNNFPREFIKEHKDLSIEWVLAYDSDKAGQKATLKYIDELKELNLKFAVDQAPSKKRDWDDCHRLDLLDDEYFWKQCRYRGDLLQAESPIDHAYCMYNNAENKALFSYRIFEFGNATHAISIDNTDVEKQMEKGVSPPQAFRSCAKLRKISNCTHEFLYIERDDLSDEQFYVLKLRYENGHKDQIVQLAGGHIDAPGSLNKALLQRGSGAKFSGNAKDLDRLQNIWFKQIKTIQSIPYVGYEQASSTYVYQTFAVKDGKVIPKNSDGFFELGREGLRTNLKSPLINFHNEFDPRWVRDLYQAFGHKGLLVLGFWVSSLFAVQIRRKYKSLPFLELTGEPAAGKSTLIEGLWYGCGRDYEGIDPAKARPAALRRTFNQVSNMPIVLIESDYNEDQGPKQAAFTFDSIKPLADGRGTGSIGIANRGNDTEEAMFQGAIVIAQNNPVHGQPATLQRIVAIKLSRGKRDTLDAYKRFTETSKAPEFAGFLPHVLKQEKEWLELFSSKIEEFEEGFWKEERLTDIQSRLVMNHNQLISAVATLPMIFGNDLITPEMVNQCHQEVKDMMVNRHRLLGGDIPILEQFWEIYHYVNDKPSEHSTPENPVIEHQLNHHKQSSEFIAINLPGFDEACRDRGQRRFDLTELKRKLPSSRRYKYVRQKKIWSAIHRKTVNCWIFSVKGNTE